MFNKTTKTGWQLNNNSTINYEAKSFRINCCLLTSTPTPNSRGDLGSRLVTHKADGLSLIAENAESVRAEFRALGTFRETIRT